MDFTPGAAVRDSRAWRCARTGQYCPVARATEILAMRWTPIIVRNLLLGCETFSQLQDGAPGISRTLLSRRLDLLEHYGIVERLPGPRYRLTPSGRDLEPVVDALGTWGARWLEVAPQHLDAHVVLWSLCRLTQAEDMPAHRLVIRFELRTVRGAGSGWCSARPTPRSASSRRAMTRTSSWRPTASGWRSGTWAGSHSARRCTRG